MATARIPQFYRLSRGERIAALVERGLVPREVGRKLADGGVTLSPAAADKMVENVVAVFGLPLGVGMGLLVDGREVPLPMVVEEASIVAALSASAKLVAAAGGFTTRADRPLLIGQVQVVDVPHPGRARHALLDEKAAILNLANSLHPKMVARGGGARDLEVHTHPRAEGDDMLVVHLLVDTCDAMGANLVNTMCEGVAALVERVTGGRVFLRILSNLTDRAMVHAHAHIPAALLAARGLAGEVVRDNIVAANDFAVADPYRAATHNKGIMNAIDAVALATGNDWRAIEAAAHAHAGRGASYTALTQWTCAADGALVGHLALPLKVGTVGGNLATNPGVAAAHALLGCRSAGELARVMAAAGLAQNLGALRALVTDGIQRGHMTLHARSVAASAGVPEHLFDNVVERLVDGGEVKVWRAREIIDELAVAGSPVTPPMPSPPAATAAPARRGAEGAGHGKVVLLGEHAVVYGSHALAVPLPTRVRAYVEDGRRPGVHLVIPAWGVEGTLPRGADKAPELRQNSLWASLAAILAALEVGDRDLVIEVEPALPRAMGLGGSAALAVAIVRALAAHVGLELADEAVDRLAFAAEKIAHGTPSGVDNAVATYGRPLLFCREGSQLAAVRLPGPLELVVGVSGVESLTQAMVAQVAAAWQRRRALYDGIFAQVDELARAGAAALEAGNLALLGELMSVNQGLLTALCVSRWELEELVGLARRHGALGAKLTGAGGGGSVVALCPSDGGATQERVGRAMAQAGYAWFAATLPGEPR